MYRKHKVTQQPLRFHSDGDVYIARLKQLTSLTVHFFSVVRHTHAVLFK